MYFGRLSAEKGLVTLVDAVKNIPVTLEPIGTGPLEVDMKGKCPRGDYERRLYRVPKERGIDGGAPVSPVLHPPFRVVRKSAHVYFGSVRFRETCYRISIGGIAELVKDNVTGLTFEPRNISDLREKISFLLNNSGLAEHMGRQARKMMEEDFLAEVHYQRLLAVYQQAIADRHKSNGGVSL